MKERFTIAKFGRRQALPLALTLGATACAALIHLAGRAINQKTESITLEDNVTKCLDWWRTCYTNETRLIRLIDNSGNMSDYRGQTWAVSWGNANNNKWPDLYLNHHKEDNTSGRFPTSHLILDLGKHMNTGNFLSPAGDDQHSAIFFDFDSDGTDEILETIGGYGGNSKETDANSFNIIHKPLSPEKADLLKGLGIEQGGARGRQVVPFVLDNKFFLGFLNKDRQDGKYGSNILSFNKAGSFLEEKLVGHACAPTSHCPESQYTIDGYQTLWYSLVSNDKLPDLIACQSNRFSNIKLLTKSDKSSKRAIIITDARDKYRFCEPSYFPQINSNGIVTLTKKGGLKLLTYENKSGSFKEFEMLPLAQKAQPEDLAVADLNNDGFPDILVLQQATRKQKLPPSLSVLLSNGACNKSDPFGCYRQKLFLFPGVSAPRNISLSDFNNNGSLDILIGAGKTKPGPTAGGRYLFLSGKSSGNWLTLDLKCANGSNAIGAVAKVVHNNIKITRLKTAGTRYETQDDSRIHIGLGNSRQHNADIEVTWPNNSVTSVKNAQINKILTIKAPAHACSFERGNPQIQ